METAKVRIDTLMDIYLGKIPQFDENAETIYITNSLIGYWTQSSVEEAVKWFNEQFGENLAVPTYD